MFNTSSENCSSNEASEVETAPSVIKLTDENFSKKFKKNSVGQVQNYHLHQVCEYFDLSKKELKKLDVFCCKHTEKRHRAKFMCHSCYHQKGNTKKASACEHSTRPPTTPRAFAKIVTLKISTTSVRPSKRSKRPRKRKSKCCCEIESRFCCLRRKFMRCKSQNKLMSELMTTLYFIHIN